MSNPNDATITEALVTTLEDGRAGYELAAETVESAELARTFAVLANQRKQFASRLTSMAAVYGDDIDVDGSALASLHRAWMSFKEAVTGSEPGTLINTCITGEDHALQVYGEILEMEMSPGLREVASQQLADIQNARTTLESMLVAA